MKIWVVVCLVTCNVLNLDAAQKKPRPQPATVAHHTGIEADDLSDKEVVKAILPHLALVVKSFFIIVQEHQNFNTVITNIGQMIMSFFTIGSYMLRTPELHKNYTQSTRTICQKDSTALLSCLAQQYTRLLAAQACS
ncbi:hypothetical protein Noda2021_10020 [Candidatus Dependentiae bacterium Noda2021]|nr:hypothetical protein Noda2021_10020 [Candidatus Dependentiae bacterium Noda2021]